MTESIQADIAHTAAKLVVEDGMQRLYESVDAWLKEEKISK